MMKKLGLVAVSVAMCCLSSAHAALVAHYTFDDADTMVTGDGTSIATAFNGVLKDVSGNGNDATNISTQLSQLPAPEPNVNGMAIRPGEPGMSGQSHKFWRDPSDFNLDSANTTWTVAPGVVPVGNAPRTFVVKFRQEVDVTAGNSQDKLFGYGTNSSGQALDISLEGGGIRLRHFGGNITYGSGFDFQETGADAGWHDLMVRVNNGATTFADVDVFLDGTQLAVSATAGGGTGVAINIVDAAAATGFPNYGFGIGTSSERAGGSSQNGFQGWIDDFKIYDTAVPEPASAMLLLMGLTSTLLARQRHA